MAEHKYTPGPWKSEGLYIGSDRPANIGQAYVKSTWQWGKKIIDHEGHANARLMAAAPELLEALISIVARLEANVSIDFNQITPANEAINKALGK